jgi:shikimate 5-dehydrogenase
MSRGFYRARFESTAKKLVTQLAGIYGIVVNALETSDEELLEELTHMNFLRPGATWIELRPGPPNSPLLAEVVGAGAEVELGSRVLARADAAWAQAAWGVELQVEAHASRLQATVAAEQNAY